MYLSKIDQGIPRPLGMKLETTSTSDSKIHLENQSSKTKINISTSWHLGKGKDMLKTTVITLQNHATDNKRVIHKHAKSCMSKPARKSHREKVTCEYSC